MGGGGPGTRATRAGLDRRNRRGAVAPVGHPQPLRTLVDTWLQRYDEVWAAAGHSHTVFRTTFSELLRITGGTPADIGTDLR
jgi:prolyl-tRNA editing enzyme YbaK/EbsC (Cys-tRNA(Pro) deacylase)